MKPLTIIISLIIFCSALLAGVPNLINYQGYLTDTDGDPLSGEYSVAFMIYDQEESGSLLWSENQDLMLSDGRFNTILGSVNSFPATLFHSENCFLTVKIGSDPEMTPRKQITSVAYAFRSENSDSLNGHSSDDFVKSGQANAVTTEMVEDNYISSLNSVVNDGGNIDLVAGTNVSITPNDAQNKITISASGGGTADNLGNHTATQNIRTNGHWISGDGGDEGLFVDSNGKLGIGTDNLSLYDPGLTINADKLTGIYSYGNSVGGRFVGSTAAIQSLGRIWAYSGGDEEPTGEFFATNDDGCALYAEAQGNDATGLYVISEGSHAIKGIATNIYDDLNYGGSFRADGYEGIGIFAGGNQYSAYLSGDVYIRGTVSKTAGSFKIDHPDDPENMYLQHSFVESPDMMNVYNGNVILDQNGEATVQLPDYFESLNQDFRYQLTCIGGFAKVYIAEEIKNNQFKIAGGNQGMKVSWMVTGIRHDAYARNHRIEVEVPKEEKDQGKYLFPKEHNQPESLGIQNEEEKRLEKLRKKNEMKLKRKERNIIQETSNDEVN